MFFVLFVMSRSSVQAGLCTGSRSASAPMNELDIEEHEREAGRKQNRTM